MRVRLSACLLLIGITIWIAGTSFLLSLLHEWEMVSGDQQLSKISVNLNHAQVGSASEGLNWDEAKRLQQFWDNESVFYARADMGIQEPEFRTHTQADVLGISSDYATFHQLWFKEGSMFSDQAVQEHSRIVALSEELAEQLFHSGNVTGLQVEIGGEAFVIAGVFAKAASVLTSMADDNVPDLFMPVTTWLDQHPEGKITTMELAVIQDNNHDFAISERLTAAFIAAGKDPPTRYVITNFSKEYEMANSKSHMLEIVMGIACMWIVVRVAWRCLRTAVLLFTQDLQLNEPLDIWRQNWRIIAPQFLGLLVSCGVLAWMASRMSQPFYVDPEWIPQRLIDLSFYKARVEEYWQEKQTMLGYIPSLVELYKDRLNLLMNVLVLLITGAGSLLLLLGVREWRLQGYSASRTVIHIGLFTLVGVICSWLLADLAGIDYLINWHIVGLILVFLVYHKWFARRNNSL